MTTMTTSDREIAEDRARYIGQRSPLFARIAGLPSSPAERCFLNFAQQPVRCETRSLSSFSLSFVLSLRATLLREAFPSRVVRRRAVRKGVLGPIISREYHYGYNTAGLSIKMERVHRWPVWMHRERVVVAKERHKRSPDGPRDGLKISTRLDRDRSNIIKWNVNA